MPYSCIVNFTHFLGQLFDVTKTPLDDQHSFLHNAEIKTRLSSLLARPRRVRYALLNDDQIALLIDFVLRLVDTPSTLRGLVLAEIPTKLLLYNALKKMAVTLAEIIWLTRIVSHWYDILKHSPDTNKYLSTPYINESVIFRFHIDSVQSSTRSITTYPSIYKAYAMTFHIALRFKQSQEGDEGTYNGYGLIARDFFRYLSPDLKEKTIHPIPINKEYYSAFMRGYDIKEFNNSLGELSGAAKRKGSCLKRLLNFSRVSPHQNSGHGVRRRRGSNPDHDILNNYPPDDHPDQKKKSVLRPRVNMEFMTSLPYELGSDDPDMDVESEAFEAPMQIPIFKVYETNPSRKPSLQREWISTINLRSFKFAWSSQYLQLFNYAIIHAQLKAFWGINGYLTLIVAFIYILIHTGIDEHYLIRLVFYSTDDIATKPAIRRANGRYYIVIQSLIRLSEATLKPALCLQRSDTVWIPLPDPISAMFDTILSSGEVEVFTYTDSKGVRQQLNLLDIDNFITKNLSNCCKYHPFVVSRALICNSVLPLYHHQFGLDPLIAVLIAGRDHHHLYKAQLHYTYIEHGKLEQEYLAAFGRVSDAISGTLALIARSAFSRSVPGEK